MTEYGTEERLRECFTDFADGEGFVKVSELRNMIEYLHFPLPDDYVDKLEQVFDLRPDQMFDFDKFYEFMEPLHRDTKAWQMLHDAFEIFDDDGDGKINVNDLAEILSKFGEKFTREEIQHMKAIVKPDENDLIDINLVTDMLICSDDEQEEEEEEYESRTSSEIQPQQVFEEEEQEAQQQITTSTSIHEGENNSQQIPNDDEPADNSQQDSPNENE